MPVLLIAGTLVALFALGAAFMGKKPVGPRPSVPEMSDAQLATIIAAANVGNPNAVTVLAAMNVSTDPAVRAQLERVLASMTSMRKPTMQPQG